MSAEARNIQQAIVNAHKAGDVQAAERLGQLYNSKYGQKTQVAPEDRDSAFEYSVDQAQKMYGGAVQNVGRLINSPGIEQYGKQVSDQQDKDIEKGGYQSQYSTARDSFNKEGLPGVLKWATEGVQENAVSGGASLVGAAGTAAAAYFGAPVWVVGALGTLTLGNSITLNTGDNVLEQQEKTGDFDATVATGVGVIAGILDRIGAGRAIPKPDLAKMTTEEVIGELMKQGKKKAAVEFAKRIGAEGITETAQEALNMGGTALVGGQYTSEEVADRLTDSFLLGSAQSGVMNTGIKAVQGTANIASKFSPKSGASAAKMVRANSDNIRTSEDMEAAASLAQRLASISDANEYDLEDIEKMSTTGARETVDKAHVQYTEELKQLFKDLKDRVKVNDQDSLQEIVDKILAEAAYREGRNKTKNTVGRQEMDALERLAGDTFEGQQALNILKQLNQLTQIHNNGYQGGVSQVTDQFSPFGSSVGYDRGAVATERLLRPIVSGSAALSTGGASLLGQLAAQGTGRMIDKVTGNRSKVRKYVEENQGGQPLATPNAPSLRMQKIAEAQAAQEAEIAAQAAAEQRAAEEREANLARVQAGAPPLMGSPEDVFRDGTGLDRSGLAQVIRILKSNPNTRAATRRAIEAYETSIATGGRVDFSLIRDINALVDQYPQLQQLQVRPRNQGAATQAVQQQLSQQDANYQRGIENNKAFAQQLQDALAEDNSVLPIHKAHLGEALNQMQLDLGAAPVKRLKAIEDRLAEKGVPAEAAAKYFAPYVERVVAQQEAKADRDATAAALDEDPVDDARIVPVPRGNERMQQIFGVTEPGEGGNYIDLDSKEDLTGNTYTGGVVKIIDGKPLLETNDAPAAPATKESGNKVKVNLFKQKAGWKWIDYDGPETIVSTHQGSKHHYSLSSDFETPVTLQTYPTQPSEPRLRPTSQGKVVLGNKIGSISVRGKVHPVYDQVTIVDKRDQEDPVNDSRGIGRISPAMPTGAKPIFDHGVDKRPVSLELIKQDPTLPGRIVAKMRPYIPLQNAPDDEQSFLEQTVEFMKDNLLALYGSVSPEYRERSKLWYVGANKLSQNVADKYGQSLEAVAGVMSALSPGLDWYVNYDIGVRLLDIHKNHQDTVFGDAEYKAAMKFVNSIKPTTPKKKANKKRHKDYVDGIRGKTLKELDFFEKAYFVRFYDVANATERGHRIITPEGDLGDFVLNKDGTKKDAVFSDLPPIAISMAILSDPSPDNISSLLGRGHKRRNFYNNIYAPNNDQGDVTIDTHAVAASLFLPLSQKSIEVVQNFGTPDSTNVGSYGTYGVYAEAYRRAAAQVGILPREMQSITWEAVRGLFPATWKQQKKNVDSIRNVWDDYKNGKLSLEQARKTVYEKAGNIRSAQWEDERPSFGIDEKQGNQTNSRGLPRTSVPGRNELGSESNAPGRVSQPAQEVKGPVLATEDPVNNSVDAAFARVQRDYLEPTPAEIKEKLPEAENIVQFTIGKKGTSYEEGITSETDIRRIADLLNISISVIDLKGDLSTISKDSRGNYKNTGRGTSGEINVRSPNIIGKPQYLVTLLHEVSHGLEAQTLDGEEAGYAFYESPHPKGSKAHDADHFRHGSFRNHMHYVLRLARGEDIYDDEYGPDVSHLTLPDYDEAVQIRKEIDAIQEDTAVRFPGFAPGSVDTEGLKIRPSMDKLIEKESRREAEILVGTEDTAAFEEQRLKSKKRMQKAHGNPYKRYIKKTAEFSVDALLLYLIDPQMMKLVAPTTSKYIQKVYNKANMPVKFYSSPLVTVLAILLAGLAKGMGGEEEEQQPGALSMQPGLLTT